MPFDAIKKLILEEQTRQGGQFIQGVDIETYLAKIFTKAEIVSDFTGDYCRGFIAYYCNDVKSGIAFITLLLVNKAERKTGVGSALVDFVVTAARRKGYTACRLEVNVANKAAYDFYMSKNFRVVEERGNKYILEVNMQT